MADTTNTNDPANTSSATSTGTATDTTNVQQGGPKVPVTDDEAWKWLYVMISITALLIVFIVYIFMILPCHEKGSGHGDLTLLLSALCGSLGAMAYVLNSFTAYWGNGRLYKSWQGFYVIKPFLGAGLAIVFFFLFGTKYFLSGKGNDANSLYTLLAVSFLVGMFTDTAISKLTGIVKILLSADDDREDKLKKEN